MIILFVNNKPLEYNLIYNRIEAGKNYSIVNDSYLFLETLRKIGKQRKHGGAKAKAKMSETIKNEITISLSKLEKVKRWLVRETCKKRKSMTHPARRRLFGVVRASVVCSTLDSVKICPFP